MKPLLFVLHLFVIAPAILGQPLGLDLADFTPPAGDSGQPVLLVVAWLSFFGSVGLLLLSSGYRLFRQCIPLPLERRRRD